MAEFCMTFGVKYEKGTCFWNREVAGPSGCKFPAPQPIGLNRALWKLFGRSSGSTIRAGMDGQPTGRPLSDYESGARALDIPWCETVIERISTLENIWLEWAGAVAKREAELAKAKARARAKAGR